MRGAEEKKRLIVYEKEICISRFPPCDQGRKKVFQLLKCSEESETYETFREEYRELSPEVKEAMEALAVVCLEEERMYVFLTVGEKISALASSYFNSGDYVKGMLADAMADTLLFEVEHQLMAELKEIAAEWKVGVKARLEAPADLPRWKPRKRSWNTRRRRNLAFL